MAVVILILAALAVVVLAFVFVGHAVGSTEAMPDQIVIDTHEAIEFCAQALPDHVTASLSYDELRRLLRLHLEWIQAYHWAPASAHSVPIIFEQYDPVDYVMERCQAVGLEVTVDQAVAVMAAHNNYLQVVGALHLDDPVEVEADLAIAPQIEGADRAALVEPGPVPDPEMTGTDDDPASAEHGEPPPEHGP